VQDHQRQRRRRHWEEGRLAGHHPADVRADDKRDDDVERREMREGAPTRDPHAEDAERQEWQRAKAQLQRARALVRADQLAKQFHGRAARGIRAGFASRSGTSDIRPG
jgi:hypothetical protein